MKLITNYIVDSVFLQALGVFGLCQIFAFIEYVRARLSKEYFETLLKAVLWTVFSGVVAVGIILSITGEFFKYLILNRSCTIKQK